MKKIILLTLVVLAIFAPGIIKAQTSYPIPNGSFETWTSTTQPTGWVGVSGTIMQFNGVQYTKSTIMGKDTFKTSVFRPAKDGKYCVFVGNAVVGTNLNLGLLGTQFPFTAGKPAYFSMNYAYFGLSTESAKIYLIMTKWNTTTKMRDTLLNVTVTTPAGFVEPWSTLLNVNLTPYYKGSETPDTCSMVIQSTNQSSTTTTSGVFIDELFFQDNAPAGIEAPVTDNTTAISAYPNPFNGITNIHYTINEEGQAALKIYDMSGKEVATLVDGNQTMGAHDISFDANGLKNGVYFYRLQTGVGVESGKLILSK